MRWPKFITGLAAMLMMGRTDLARAEDREVRSREEMVRYQLMAGGIRDPEVLKAMSEVPRHEFVPASLRSHAYADGPLPIGHGQTISQPFIVAYMTQALELGKEDIVLEVGTGSGYQAAILGKVAKEVYSIEIVPPLAESARAILSKLGFENVYVRLGDGYLGWPEKAPFDAIIVTCAPDHIPEPLISQLKEGGRLVIPVGERGAVQQLVLLRKENGVISKANMLDVRFVPMTGEMTNGLTDD
ncbi:MAG TPA: protein-L-isoaspartate(D-aspartate) O-methyltransferase [Terrimicrobiaceae bacterium]